LDQRAFIQKLTEICEELRFAILCQSPLSLTHHSFIRFVERPERQTLLKQRISEVEIPRCCYLALLNSTDKWSKVLCTLPNESHAFSTKARCPALLLFEMQDHPNGLDVASFLGGTELLQELSSDELMSQSTEDKSFHDNPPQKFKSFFKNSPKSPVIDGNEGDEGAEALALNYLNGSEDHGSGSVSKHIEPFSAKVERIKQNSPYGHMQGWRLDGLIAKSNDDLRQEVFVMQMISFLKRVFAESKVNVWILTYKIVSTSKSTGLIQLIPNSISLDGLKKGEHWPGSLRAYFESTYGPPDSPAFKAALNSYVQSLAGYSVVTYVLAIKDRYCLLYSSFSCPITLFFLFL
jgi:hypothetical protein